MGEIYQKANLGCEIIQPRMRGCNLLWKSCATRFFEPCQQHTGDMYSQVISLYLGRVRFEIAYWSIFVPIRMCAVPNLSKGSLIGLFGYTIEI